MINIVNTVFLDKNKLKKSQKVIDKYLVRKYT